VYNNIQAFIDEDKDG